MRAARVRMLLEGEPENGKTSVWAAGVDAARARGMTVLDARPTRAPRFACRFQDCRIWLGRLPESLFALLPPPQQRALDAALLRVDALGGSMRSARAVAQDFWCSWAWPRNRRR